MNDEHLSQLIQAKLEVFEYKIRKHLGKITECTIFPSLANNTIRQLISKYFMSCFYDVQHIYRKYTVDTPLARYIPHSSFFTIRTSQMFLKKPAPLRRRNHILLLDNDDNMFPDYIKDQLTEMD